MFISRLYEGTSNAKLDSQKENVGVAKERV